MRRLLTTLFLFSTMFMYAQYQAPKIFSNQDAIIVEASNVHGKIYKHTFKPKETVYSLAKTFGQKPGDLSKVNPGINLSAVSVGQQINIPFESTIMVKNPAALVRGKDYVNVYYEVQPKDNLYRISKVYFAQSVETIMEINRLENPDLKIGQKVLVGWLPVDGQILNGEQTDYPIYTNTTANQEIQPDVVQNEPVSQPKTETPTVVSEASSPENTETKEKQNFLGKLKKTFGIRDKKTREEIKDVVNLSEELEEEQPAAQTTHEKAQKTDSPSPTFESTVSETSEEPKINSLPESEAETANIVYKQQKGIAIWNQSSTDSNNMFALHPTAKVGSMIEITNPMMGKTIEAKVIGNIPPRTYTDDVAIVVSPKVAEMLGAMDRRFTVKLKYHE